MDVPGICGASIGDFGCANLDGMGNSGNPNDAVNCFDVTDFGGSPPFFVSSVRFWLGTSIRLPADLEIRAWNGTVATGPTTTLLYSEELSGYVQGENTVQLLEPLEVLTDEFCIGLASQTVTDGLRVGTEAGSGVSSFVIAPVCGGPDFTALSQLTEVGFSLDLCIEALVFGL
jgi:hypothetical protein